MIVILLVGLGCVTATAQDSTGAPEWFGLEHLTEYLGLKSDDIGYRADYTEPDSFRLQVITDLMEKPLGMLDYAAARRGGHVQTQPEILAGILLTDLRLENQLERAKPYQPSSDELHQQHNLYYNNMALNQLLSRAALYLEVILPRSTEKALSRLSPVQRKFLHNEFKELLVTRDDEEFMSIQQLDSIESIEEEYTEQFVEFGYEIDPDPILAAGIDCLREMILGVKAIRQDLQTGRITPEAIMNGTGILPDDVRAR